MPLLRTRFEAPVARLLNSALQPSFANTSKLLLSFLTQSLARLLLQLTQPLARLLPPLRAPAARDRPTSCHL